MTHSQMNQAHQHAQRCGDLGVRHEGHVDYLNHGHLDE